MKKKYIKIITIIIIALIFLNLYYTISIAVEWSTIIEEGNDFIEKGKVQLTMNSEEIRDTSNTIFNMLLLLGTFLSVAVGGIIGIKFMTASAEDKAKIKESMIPYIFGCIVIFGAAGICKLAISIFSQL